MKDASQVVIIGSGIAALQAARHLAPDMNVIIVTKTSIRQSNSYYAQGGIAAVLSKQDTLQSHIEDTIQAGEFHHDAVAVEHLVTEGARCVKELLEEGLPADRNEGGTLSLGLEGAHSRSRIVHAGGDATGKWTIEHLLKVLPENVVIKENEMAYELVVLNGTCIGVKAKTKEGQACFYKADHTVLATGGAGALYPFTSNQETITGDGIALAYRAGAVITDMEFIQFHPTLLYVNGETKGLVSEAVRGAGAVLIDETGRRIMEKVHPLMDLAPRHITAFEIYKARKNGREVFLDISMIPHFEKKFPTISAMCRKNGISLEKGQLPVAPGSHFLMGGIKADTYGRTSINRLYAIGEVACTGVHGANRLASNSLLEGVAFGKRFADAVTKCEKVPETNKASLAVSIADLPPLFGKKELQTMMMEGAGIIRTKKGLYHLVDCLKHTAETTGDITHLPVKEIEQFFMHITAYLIAKSALKRTETRGAHVRTDFPHMEEKWTGKWIDIEAEKINVRSGKNEFDQARQHAESFFY